MDQARKQVGLSLNQLWVDYFQMGGKADPLEFEAIFDGLLRLDSYQYNVIAHALNECFTEQGENHPVPYAEAG